MQKLIKKIMIDKDVALYELAETMNTTSVNLCGKLKRDNLRINELKAIANALNCTVDIKIIDNDTKKAYAED